MINVEFPINEKYRKYLKIEYLFNQYNFFIKQKHSDHINKYSFSTSYLNLIRNAARADIKVELINDLQRIITKYKTNMMKHQNSKKALKKLILFLPLY